MGWSAAQRAGHSHASAARGRDAAHAFPEGSHRRRRWHPDVPILVARGAARDDDRRRQKVPVASTCRSAAARRHRRPDWCGGPERAAARFRCAAANATGNKHSTPLPIRLPVSTAAARCCAATRRSRTSGREVTALRGAACADVGFCVGTGASCAIARAVAHDSSQSEVTLPDGRFSASPRFRSSMARTAHPVVQVANNVTEDIRSKRRLEQMSDELARATPDRWRRSTA